MRISYWSSDVCSSGLKGHLRAWRKFARRGEPLVERFEGPGAALALQCVGKCESGFARSDFLTHDGVKIETDAIGAALIDRVAGNALLEHGFALCGIRAGEQRVDGGTRFCALSAFRLKVGRAPCRERGGQYV